MCSPHDAEALLDCFKNCSFFGWCCKEENSAFWRCYEQERVRPNTEKASVVLMQGCFNKPAYAHHRAAVPQKWVMPCLGGWRR